MLVILRGLTPARGIKFNDRKHHPNLMKTRPAALVAGYHDSLKNQRIGIVGIDRETYQAVSTTTVLAAYKIVL